MNDIINNSREVIGMKWFKFFTKVRPCFLIIFSIPACCLWVASIVEILSSTSDVAVAILICMVNLFLTALVVAYIIYNIFLLIKAYSNVSIVFIRKYLIFESYITVFFASVSQLGKDEELLYDETWIIWFVLLIIDILMAYFIWYKMNMKYFEKRLVHNEPSNDLQERIELNEQKDDSMGLASKEITHICLSSADEQPKIRNNSLTYSEDIMLKSLPNFTTVEFITGNLQSSKIEFNAHNIAKELSEKCAKTVIQINRKCNEIGIDYSERKFVIATFSYFFAKWAYTSKNITFAQVGEVQNLYKEQFSEFNKVAFQDDSFKSVMENEQIFAETLEKFLSYAKDFYNSENNSFSKEFLEKYILEFVKNESDVVTLKEFL